MTVLTLFHIGQKILSVHGVGGGRFCPSPVTFEFVNLLRPNLEQ